MTSAPISAADPFDAGPYARLQAALNRRRLWSSRAPLRAVTLAAIAWLPLLVLAAVQGLAWTARGQESLLLDPSVYARYLITLPVLVLAQPLCLLPLAMIARYFPRPAWYPRPTGRGTSPCWAPPAPCWTIAEPS